MSITGEDFNLATLPNGALRAMLEEAELEERGLSDRRRELHDLIRAKELNPTAPDADFELAALSQRERALSTQRLLLHERILELRQEKSRRIDGLRRPLRAVDGSA